MEPILVFGIPIDFILFALTLLGVALFHHKTLQVALAGLAAIVIYKLVFTGFKHGAGLAGLGHHMAHEWVTLVNLFLLAVHAVPRCPHDAQIRLSPPHLAHRPWYH